MNMQKLICLENLVLCLSEALGLLRFVKSTVRKVGLSFHVGSQCMDKISFSKELRNW